MRPFVERQRFRTWAAERDVRPSRQWRIILRYSMLPVLRSWYVYTPLIMWSMALLAVVGISITTLSARGGDGSVSGTGLIGLAFGFLAVAALFTLLVGSRAFSEDLRFNAPLFYFSKPLRMPQYAIGKIVHIAVFVFVTALVPVLLWLLLGLLLGLPLQQMPDFTAWYGEQNELIQREEHAWHVTTIEDVGEWLYAFVTVVPGILVTCTFLVSLAAAIGVHTRRGWHAAMGLVAVVGGWGMLGLIASDFHRTALQHAYGPFGWIHAVVALPLELMFSVRANPYTGTAAREFAHAGPTILVGYVMLLGISALCIQITLARLRRTEALL